jgi:CubicO group peptidase (beta-lactamase class C family)
MHLRIGFAAVHTGYGYQTWILGEPDFRSRTGRHPREGGDPVFAAFGVRGQAIYVDPATRVVMVHTAVWDENVDREARAAQFDFWGRVLKTLSAVGPKRHPAKKEQAA